MLYNRAVRYLTALLLCFSLSGCLSPREFAESSCEMAFLAGLTHLLPMTPTMYGAACSFGVRMIADTDDDEEDDDEEEGEDD